MQAIALVRRMFDAAYAAKSPGIIAVLLDWAKAFDRIRTSSMLQALKRFGLPTEMLEMIASIYDVRHFVLRDPCGDSTQRVQKAGIAQGCPLSPYLFILVQTVLLHDVDKRLQEECRPVSEPEYIVCSDVLYADDTLLMSSGAAKLQRHLELVVDEGKRYGLELNWKKTMAMRIGNAGDIRTPSGEAIGVVEQAVYLGGLLSTTGCAKLEVTRRLGEARGGFKALAQCWAHANIDRTRKILIYTACIVTKLLYNLESLWLLQADLQRLNAFHVKCLRKIYNIACSYESRVSNAEVLRISNQPALTETLQERQAKLYRQTASLSEDHVLRQVTCERGSDRPRKWCGKRRPGRPKQQWATCVYRAMQA